MNVAIIGSRSIKCSNFIETKLSELHKSLNFTLVISGGALGVDSIATNWAESNSIKTKTFKPDYSASINKKMAPLLRNVTIVENSDLVIAFWDGKSRGTQHALGIAKKLNKRTMVIPISPSYNESTK